MDTSKLRYIHKQFPGLPARAVEFFHVSNIAKVGKSVTPRTVMEFSADIAKAGTHPNSQTHPPMHSINNILQRLADYNILTTCNRGSFDSHDASYLCVLDYDERQSILELLDYIVYGFPVIYDDFSSSVVPIIHTSPPGCQQIGTSFVRTKHVLLTAAHCVTNASGLSIKGICRCQFNDVHIFANEQIDIAAICLKEPALSEYKNVELAAGEVLDDVMVLGYPSVPGFTEVCAAEKATISARLSGATGIVASRATEIFAKVPLFLITARVRGGFSGGPVINSSGLCVGVVSRQPISQHGHGNDLYTQYDNLGYGVAIPSEEVSKFLLACRNGDRSLAPEVDATQIDFKEFPE